MRTLRKLTISQLLDPSKNFPIYGIGKSLRLRDTVCSLMFIKKYYLPFFVQDPYRFSCLVGPKPLILDRNACHSLPLAHSDEVTPSRPCVS